MDLFLFPSLEKAAIVRIALFFYRDCEAENTICGQENTLLPMLLIEMKIEQKLSSLLPSLIKRKMAQAIHFMQDELKRWKDKHEFLLKHIDKSYSCLCWKMNGTISRTQTAKKLIDDDTIDPKVRFILACSYFLEDEVTALWGRYKEILIKEIKIKKTNFSVAFWMKWLRKKKNRKHWSVMIDAFFRNRTFHPGTIPMRISNFYHFLSKESKHDIDSDYIYKTDDDDFQMCMNEMNVTERIEFFSSKAKSLRVLQICLKWPFRPLFINMAREAMESLGPFGFAYILKSLLNGYISIGYVDFHLFEAFWEISPSYFKDIAKKKEFIIRVKNKILKDEDIPQDFKETLSKCMH